MTTSEPSASPHGDERDVRHAIRSFYMAIERFDTRSMRSILTRDFELTEPRRAIHWDRDEFVSRVSAMKGKGTPRYVLDEFFTQRAGRRAYAGYRNRLTFVSSTGEKEDETIEFATLMWTANGWKIARIHGFPVQSSRE